ncbi:MAG: OmpP1/FadL family transporter [Crocinitomicaceae bacterium]
MKRLLIAALAISGMTYGQGYQVNLQGQIQQGMGSAGSALPTGASSMFYNPGASAFVDHNDIEIGATAVFGNVLFTDANNGENWRTNSPVGTPFAAYGLFKPSDSSRISLGLAIYTPFGSTVSYESGWTGRFALTRLELMSIFTQPTVSFKISDKLSLGAGIVYSYGRVNLQRDLPITFASGEYASVELSGKGHGFGFNTGLYFKPTDKLSFGISYRSEISMSVDDGIATFNVPESLDDKFPDGNFSSSLPLPEVFTLGIGITPNEKLTFAFDANYVGWDAYDTLAFDYEVNTESLEDTKSARNYVSAVAARIGAQYVLQEKYSFRLGMSYAVSPVQSGYVTPETPDNNRLSYTAGFGYSFLDKFRVDASLLFTKLERTDTNLETNLSGTFKTIVFAPGLSLNYAF